MTADELMRGFGDSLLSWINYLGSVKRGHILNEYSIRYATSEYLEINKKQDPNVRQEESASGKRTRLLPPSIEFSYSEYKYEADYPYLDNNQKKADLRLKSITDNTKDIFVEFKYLKDNTNRSVEFASDVLRLALQKKNFPQSSSYFLLITSPDSLQTYIEPNTEEILKGTVRYSNSGVTRHVTNNYVGLFDFANRNTYPVTAELKHSSEIKDKIGENYTVLKGFSDYEPDDEVTTELIYGKNLNECSMEESYQSSFMRVFIWKIGIRKHSETAQKVRTAINP